MISLEGKLKFRCSDSDCVGVLGVSASEFDFENTWSHDERGMGTENGYEATVETICPICKKEYQVNYMYTEYPEGAPNYEEFSIRDASGKQAEVELLENSLTIF